jgi:hypothetical protein
MQALLKFVVIPMLIFGIIAGCSTPQPSAPKDIRHRLAEAYGSESFSRVEVLEYTFNVQIGEKQIRRSWIWWPQVNQVTFKAGADQGAMSYNRLELDENSPQDLKQIDAWFINDNYWLLFPIHMMWDRQAKVEDTGHRKRPIGEGTAKCVVVTYPATGGYTPGDVYELFVDNEYMITEWIYRRGGSETPSRITSWEDHREAGGLTFSLDHHGNDGKFRLWFTDVAVKLHGSFDWLRPN